MSPQSFCWAHCHDRIKHVAPLLTASLITLRSNKTSSVVSSLPPPVSQSTLLFSLSLKVAQSDDSGGCLLLSEDISIWRPSLGFGQITTSKGCDSQVAPSGVGTVCSLALSPLLSNADEDPGPLEHACPSTLNKTLSRRIGSVLHYSARIG